MLGLARRDAAVATVVVLDATHTEPERKVLALAENRELSLLPSTDTASRGDFQALEYELLVGIPLPTHDEQR